MKKASTSEKLLLALSIFCMLYYLVHGFFVGFHLAQIWLWAVLAGIFLLWFLYLSLKRQGRIKALPKWFLIIFWAVFAIGMSLFLILEAFVIGNMLHKEPEDLDCIIILGAAVHGETPSLALHTRLNVAADYLLENPETKVICSGGQGDGENISEAEAMRRRLLQKGISEERIIPEAASTSTAENFRFSLPLLSAEDKKIGIVTNNFHVFRSLLLARQTSDAFEFYGIPAPYWNSLFLHYTVREAIVTVMDFLRGNIQFDF